MTKIYTIVYMVSNPNGSIDHLAMLNYWTDLSAAEAYAKALGRYYRVVELTPQPV